MVAPETSRRGALLILALLTAPVARADELADRAERLARLRAEVESLNEELDAAHEDDRTRLRAIEAQQVDLEVQLRRQEMRLERLLDEEAALQAALADKGEARDAALEAAVRGGITRLRALVRGGLPFKQADRLQALADLESRLDEKSLGPEQVAARLWAFVEDERRLARENALDRQVILLDGEEVLVDVARIGMVGLYFRSPGGQVGRAAKEGEEWTFRAITDPADKERVEALFDALSRGIRTGWFELPGLAG